MSQDKCAFKIDNHKCSALTKKECMRCPFFKTEEEVKASRERAELRRRSLPVSIQMDITAKYYINTEVNDQ